MAPGCLQQMDKIALFCSMSRNFESISSGWKKWLEYNPQVKSYARSDIGTPFATTYRLPIPKDAPFAIGYTFENQPHDYLPDYV